MNKIKETFKKFFQTLLPNSNKNAAESSQSEFAGVSLDDEASHLLEFQQAYQASARILQTARELFEALIRVV